jgi:sigma-E factor negative regulatory protein RseB
LIRNILCCLLLVAPLSAHAVGQEPAEDPWQLLEKAAEAAHKLNYKGVFVYQAGRNINSFQIMHVNYGTDELARVVVLDGMPREMLRQGNAAVIYQSRNEKVMIEKRRVRSSFPAILPTLTDTLKSNYQVRQAGLERVGGRDSVIVQLEPRDKLRYGYRFWVDRQLGLLLKSVMLNENAEIVEQIAFNQLGLFNNPDVNWFHPDMDLSKSYAAQSSEDLVKPTSIEGDGWVITRLPAGFHQVEQVRRNVAGKAAMVNHVVFSDGLASVSLFIEPIEKNETPKVGRCMQGATNIFADIVDDHQVVVVGEVPEATVKQIAGAVSFKK